MVIFCVSGVSFDANAYSSSVIGSLRPTFASAYGAVKSVSWPTAETTGTALRKTARATGS